MQRLVPFRIVECQGGVMRRARRGGSQHHAPLFAALVEARQKRGEIGTRSEGGKDKPGGHAEDDG